MNSRDPLMPHRGRGKELNDLLRAELGVPEGCQEFSVRFAVGEVVSVSCKYQPKERDREAAPEAQPGAREIEVTDLTNAVHVWVHDGAKHG